MTQIMSLLNCSLLGMHD